MQESGGSSHPARRIRGQSFEIGATVGLVIYPDDGGEPDQLIEKADQAMYVAKRSRKLATNR